MVFNYCGFNFNWMEFISMRTIQSRIQHCKNRVPIAAPKIEESAKLQADVDAWLAKGNEIYDADKKEANFRNDIEKSRAYKKRTKPVLNLPMWRFRGEDTILTTKDMVRVLECSSDWVVTEYTKKHLIPAPYKIRDLDGKVKITKQNHNANYWKLGDLIKHNKELEK
jgi:hypothetical protein